MDMSGESFDEYRARGSGVPLPDGPGGLGDDTPSIEIRGEDVEEQEELVGLEGHGTTAPKDRTFDFDLHQVGQKTVPGYHQGHEPFPPESYTYEGQGRVQLTPEDHQFYLESNQRADFLPGINQWNISENPSTTRRDPRARQLGPPIKLEEGSPQENMESEDHLVPEIEELELQFTSFKEAINSYEREEQTSIDTTLPQSLEDKKREVKRLMLAMMSVDEALDNPAMVKPFREGKYTRRRIETACWNVLELCIQRHVLGPLLDPWDVRAKQTSRIPDFRSRMRHIEEALTMHKTICKHLLDPPYAYAFVDDPVGCNKRVESNRALNRRKGEYMSAGKEALGGTPGSGTRGRPRKNETPGSNRGDTSSSVGPGSNTKRTPLETPRSRADSGASAHTPFESSPSMNPDSPTPTNHSALRDNRRQSQIGSPYSQPPHGHVRYGNNQSSPFGNQTSPSFNPYRQSPQYYSQSPGPAARSGTQMLPPNLTPNRSSLGASNTTLVRGTKRGQPETDDNDDIFNPYKRSQR